MGRVYLLIITYMPKIKIAGKVKHFPYTKAGRKAAAGARRKK